MQIECPSCSTDNKIEIGGSILCNKCKKPFSGFYYKKAKKTTIAATAALLIGAYGGYKANNSKEAERYPIEVEYSLINVCLNGSSEKVTIEQYIEKQDICTCALSKTMNNLSYSSYNEDQSVFFSSFENNQAKCKTLVASKGLF